MAGGGAAPAGVPPPSDPGDLRALLSPLRPRTFFEQYYNRRVLHLPATSERGFLAARVYPGSPARSLEPWLRSVHALHAWQSGRVEGKERGEDVDVPESFAAFRARLRRGSSYVAHIPSVHALRAASARAPGSAHARALARFAPLARLRHRLERVLRTPISANVYISGPSAVALAPHTDTTDTVVLQLDGTKAWALCVPPLSAHMRGAVRGAGWREAGLSDADVAELKETELARAHGCTAHPDEALAPGGGYNCRTLTLRTFELLWVPKGVVHAAREAGGGRNVSVHLTLGLQRAGQQYADFVRRALGAPIVRARMHELGASADARWLAEGAAATARARPEAGAGQQTEPAPSRPDGAVEPAGSAEFWAELLEGALDELVGGAEGIVWRRPFPSWALACAEEEAAGAGAGAALARAAHAALDAGALDSSAHNASAWSYCAPARGSGAHSALRTLFDETLRPQLEARVLRAVGRRAREGARGYGRAPLVRAMAASVLRAAGSAAAFEHAVHATMIALALALDEENGALGPAGGVDGGAARARPGWGQLGGAAATGVVLGLGAVLALIGALEALRRRRARAQTAAVRQLLRDFYARRAPDRLADACALERAVRAASAVGLRATRRMLEDKYGAAPPPAAES